MYLKQDFSSRFRILKGGLISLVVASNLYGAPSGGIVMSGDASINQSGNTTNINQSSNKASINWQNFSIANGETVNFNQPNKNSITLNRVIGNEKSIIDGALNANGQVWLINQNGTLFNKNAKVNTAGLLVTTKNLSDKDFQDGKYSFKGDSKATIENLGEINSQKYASFIANSVINNGTIKVHTGNLHLIGANDFSISLDENSNISLKVDKGVLDALVENNHLLIANGGNVYLTTNAKDELLKGVVNNRGIIEANSIDDLKQSEVIIFAHGGTANIDGTINAKGSFVETSGENLSVKDSFKITANKWLLDPTNMTIEANGGSDFNSGSVSATAIQNALKNTDVELKADNRITVNQNITWSEATQLKLSADYINVYATINNTNKTNGGVYFNASNNHFNVYFTENGKVIVNNVYQLQWINTALGGKYELGSNINASAISNFNPIGTYSQRFSGTFDGKGYTISNLTINRPATTYVGLFGSSSGTIKNIGLENVDINGGDYVGGLVGTNFGTVQNSYVTGAIYGYSYVGGLIGTHNSGTIKSSYSSGSVYGANVVGGLVGDNYAEVENSYSLSNVTAINNYVGGLFGSIGMFGKVKNSYASGTVSGNNNKVGGLVGDNFGGEISNSWYDKERNSSISMNDSLYYGKTKADIVSLLTGSEWETNTSKGRGYGLGGTTALPFLRSVTKHSNTLFEDGLGVEANPYTITNWTQLQNINSVVTQYYYYNLVNNLDKNSVGYIGTGVGWNPIGKDNNDNGFGGIFDGLGNTISDLYINRGDTSYIGLFGYLGSWGHIKNLGLENVYVKGKGFVGGLAGGIYYGGKITNSYVTGEVHQDESGGGLVGTNYGTISNSYAIVSVKGTRGRAGGLVGQNYGKIENSYASGTVSGLNGYIGGLVGYRHSTGTTIENSFYNKTLFSGNGVGNGSQTGVIGKTTQEMSYGGTFKSATWDIRVDNSVSSLTPVLKYDSSTNTYYWAISALALNYNLGNKSTTYNGYTQNLSNFYTTSSIFGNGYNFLGDSNYKLQKDGNDVSGYKNAGVYDNIKVVLTDEFLTIANSGNVDGKLTINKANLDILANSDSLVYNGYNQSVSGYIFGTNKLLGSDTVADISLLNTTTIAKNAGKYNTNLSGTSNNYNINITQGELEITKAKLDILANSDSKVYNGQNQNLSGYTFGTHKLLGSDTIADISLSNTTTTAKNAGKYNTNITGSSNNYDINVTQGELEITKANLTVIADDKTKYKGEDNPNLTYVANGLLGEDTLTGDLETTADKNSNVGIYYITKGSLDNSNYDIDFINGKLSVNQQQVSNPAIQKLDTTQKFIDNIEKSVKYSFKQEDENSLAKIEIIGEGINMPVDIVTNLDALQILGN